MGVKMEVGGFQQAQAALRAIEENYPKVEKLALENAAAVFEAEVRSRVPSRTGAVALEIKTTKVKSGRDGGGEIRVGVGRNKGVAYAVPLEWGHINRDGSVTAPRSFIGASYEAKKAEAYEAMKQTIKDHLASLGGG